MAEEAETPTARQVWVAFILAAAWLLVAGVWVAWGINQHDPFRVVLSVAWVAFAAFWITRAARRLERFRSKQTD